MANKKKTQQPTQLKKVAEKPISQAAKPSLAAPAFINQKTAILILIIAVLLAFIGGFGNDFLKWDDNFYVTENPYIQFPTFSSFLKLLKVECVRNYHPLTMLSLWLNSFLFGKAAASFIVTNTLLHICNTVLVFFLAKKLAKENTAIAFFTALIWGVHPMHVESVTWISERKDVLYALFFFLSCIQYLKFLENGKQKYWVFALIFFVLSCLSKGMAVVLPLVLVLFDYWFDKKTLAQKNILQKIPFFIVAMAFGTLAVHIQGGGNLGGHIERLSMINDSAIKYELSFFQKVCFAFYGFWVYIIKLFTPFNQHNYYAYPPLSDYGALQYIIAPFAAIALLAWAAFKYRTQKLFFFGLMFFFFTISIVLQFISVGAEIVYERYSYIPYFGPVFVLVYWLYNKISIRNLSVALGLVALIFIFLSFRQTETYKSTETLFLNSQKYEPTSVKVYEMLCDYYGEKNQFQDAVTNGEMSLSAGVTSWRILFLLAKAYYLTGHLDKSVDTWNKAVAITPDNNKPGVLYQRALMYRAAGKYPQSIADIDSIFKLVKLLDLPDSNTFVGNLHYQLGLTTTQSGDYNEAIRNFDLAVKLNPADADSIIKDKAYAECLGQQWQNAINDYTAIIKKGVSTDAVYNNRGFSKFKTGDTNGAISDWQQALKLNPNNKDAKENLKKMGVQ